MIWGCITYNGVGTLTKVDETINTAKYVEIWTVVCGQSLPGTSQMIIIVFRMTKTFMDENEIKTMKWPTENPNLNIIENVRLKLKIELQNISETVDSRDQLYDKIFQIWTNISVDYIRNLYSSIPKRIRKVPTARGYITKY
jgi:hypothetical protein